MKGSSVVILANDIQYPVGLLTVQKGLGFDSDDQEMNFIIDPTVLEVNDIHENTELDHDFMDDICEIERNVN